MVSIVSDTSTLYSPAEAAAAGFAVSPLSVTINGKSYKEYAELQPDAFIDIIHQGHLPTSSQPAVGDVAALYEAHKGSEILNLSMADGLSGTYQGALAAAGMCEDADVQVVNTRTLCGPHRYMVEAAVKLAKQGLSRAAIMEKIQPMIDTSRSYLMPSDFGYLRRGGRLSPLVSYVGQAAKLAPIMTLTEDCKQLTIAGIKRSVAQTIDQVIKLFKSQGVDERYKIYVTHAGAPEKAKLACEMLAKAFPGVELEIQHLSCAFVTQGGPGCFAMQTVLKL